MPSRAGSTPAARAGTATRGTRPGSGIRSRFERGVDWTGLERERMTRWYRQLHIFLYPFYYIEYGIAQIGALQVWRNSLRDPADAVERYRRRWRWAIPVRCPSCTGPPGSSSPSMCG